MPDRKQSQREKLPKWRNFLRLHAFPFVNWKRLKIWIIFVSFFLLHFFSFSFCLSILSYIYDKHSLPKLWIMGCAVKINLPALKYFFGFFKTPERKKEWENKVVETCTISNCAMNVLPSHAGFFRPYFLPPLVRHLLKWPDTFLKQGLPNQGVQRLPNNQFSLANSALRSA